MAMRIWVSIGSGNDLLLDGTNPLPRIMSTYHQWCVVVFTAGKFHQKCPRIFAQFELYLIRDWSQCVNYIEAVAYIHDRSTQMIHSNAFCCMKHDDVIKWQHFPRYWPFVRGIHRSPVKSPHKGQWRGALMFSVICVWINDWVNNHEAGDLRRYCAHYDVTVMV